MKLGVWGWERYGELGEIPQVYGSFNVRRSDGLFVCGSDGCDGSGGRTGVEALCESVGRLSEAKVSVHAPRFRQIRTGSYAERWPGPPHFPCTRPQLRVSVQVDR